MDYLTTNISKISMIYVDTSLYNFLGMTAIADGFSTGSRLYLASFGDAFCVASVLLNGLPLKQGDYRGISAKLQEFPLFIHLDFFKFLRGSVMTKVAPPASPASSSSRPP